MSTEGVDWAKIEAEYRTGLYSLAELRARAGNAVSRQAIQQRAKSEGWVQDFRPAIKRERERMLAGGELGAEVIATAATEQAEVIRSHKDIAARLRRVIGQTVTELEQAQDIKPPAKAATARQLGAALATVSDTERKAHGIDETSAEAESYEDRLRRIIEQAQ